jgi:hypothetical protein
VRTNKLLQGILFLGVFILGAVSLSAQQLLESSINERVGIWRPLENPTNIGRGDDPWGMIEMPFTFTYDNQNINTVYAYGNGFISLNYQRSHLGSAVPSFAQYSNLVSWYGADLYTTGSLSYEVTGTEPFRVLTIQQTGARTFLDFSGATFDAQVKLFETTNEIQIIYGNSSGIGGRDIAGGLYFSGSSGRFEYINIKPENPIGSSTLYYYNQNQNTTFWLTEAVKNFLPSGKTYTLSPNPSISDIYPGRDDLLQAGDIYEGDFRPYVRFNRGASQEEVAVQFKIEGPLPTTHPDFKTIYVAVNEEDEMSSETVDVVPQPVGNGVVFRMPHAKDIAGRLSDGALDMATNEDQLPGGEYRVTAILTTPDNPFYSATYSTITNVALSDDIAITGMESPVSDPGVIYSISSSIIPVKITVKNLGKNAVTAFKATAKIYKNAALIEELPAFEFENEEDPLEIGESMDVIFPDFVPQMSDGVGEYTIVTEVELLSAGEDKLPSNNIFPRTADGNYVFNIGHEIEAEASELINPGEEVYLGSPLVPSVSIINNGVADINDAYVSIQIVSPGGDVYEKTVRVDAIPHGIANQTLVFFDETFIPEELGTYQVTIAVDAIGDLVFDNNILNTTFTVVSGMSGDYHITAGDIDVDEDRVFRTIDDALDTLYMMGVSGDVTFFFYEEDYHIGDVLMNEPAMDLSSEILGVNAENTVTFKAHESVENTANIYLHSGNGVGVLFGQNFLPNNIYAPIQRALEGKKRDFANSNGFIVFDGGADKKLKFELVSNTQFKTVFNLAQGASNITLKNLQISGGTSPDYDCFLPSYSYDATLGRFTFDANDNALGGTFTAGVLLRSVPPVGQNSAENEYGLDTLMNHSNMIDGNKIHGFGYGIVSIGLGVLKSPVESKFVMHYNHNNHFVNNTISDIGRAGIFLGNTYKSNVEFNRIYDVHSACGQSAAGILLGMPSMSSKYGFHNIEPYINGNEISHLSSDMYAVGIDVFQQMLVFDDLGEDFVFPVMDEKAMITNNMIWGFVSGASAGFGNSKIGIGLHVSETDEMYYNSTDDVIANNTIVIEDDGLANDDVIAGARLYRSAGTKFYNNAIAVLDETFDWEDAVVAAVYYEGFHPKRGGIESNHNAYYLPDEDAQIFRFIEIDGKHRVLEAGYNKEFVQLDQWRQWTNQDWSSVEGDFIKDHILSGDNPPSLMISQANPPFNSILNIRGMNTDYVKFDIQNKRRGIAESQFDIGAYEFNGSMSDRDVELITVVSPGTYKATPPMPYSDVQYVMIPDPERHGNVIRVRIRNNSDKAVGGIPVTLKEWRQSHVQDSTEEAFVMEDEFVVNIERLDAGEETIVEFNSEDIIPRTYAEFRSPNQPYDIPEEYLPLEANVTPIYKYTFHLENDELISNNALESTYRFYIQKSNVSLLLSVRGIDMNINPDSSTVNDIATNLNLDSLVSGFFQIGWFIDIEREDPVINIDIFDREVWEPRSVNYPLYRTLFWVDGHDTYDMDGATVDNNFRRYERLNIATFLESGKVDSKKNFVLGSQELVRNATDDLHKDFVNHYLRTQDLAPGNPLGAGADYSGNIITGIKVGRETQNMVKATGFENDELPQPGLIQIYDDEDTRGTSRIGYVFNSRTGHNPDMGISVPESERIAGIATVSLENNVFNMGVDWRHWEDIETVLRAILDFLENNEGHVIPVELLDFNAYAVNDRVEVTWKTAGEYNSSHFELDRAFVNGEQIGNFMNIDNVEAAGKSSVIKNYGPFVDWSVASGNTYAYRLKSVDKDGEFSYSEPVIVTLDGINNISISEAKPNPITDNSVITYNLNNSANVFIAIYDVNGNMVANPVDEMKSSGNYEININASEFASGKYTLVYRVGNSMLTRSLNIVK